MVEIMVEETGEITMGHKWETVEGEMVVIIGEKVTTMYKVGRLPPIKKDGRMVFILRIMEDKDGMLIRILKIIVQMEIRIDKECK